MVDGFVILRKFEFILLSMESKTKNLISVVLKNYKGSEIEFNLGDKIHLLNPNIFQNPVLRRNQYCLNKIIQKEIGKGPYKILEIIQEDSVTYFNIKGKRKIKEKIITQYFRVDDS
jgi:hypothetical protein